MSADWGSPFPSSMPGCGADGISSVEFNSDVGGAPRAVWHFSQGSGTNVPSLDDGQLNLPLTMNSDLGWVGLSPGDEAYTANRGLAYLCKRHSSLYRRGTTTASGFQHATFTAVVVVGFSGNEGTINNQGLMMKGASDNTRTKGWGIQFTNTGILRGWIDDPTNSSKRVDLDISSWQDDLPLSGIIQMKYDGATLLLRAYTSYGVLSATATVTSTTLGLSEGNYSPLVVGGCVDASTPGTLNYDGTLLMAGYWPSSLAGNTLWEALKVDPMCLAKYRRGGNLQIFSVPNGNLQGGEQRFGLYIPDGYDPTKDPLFVDFPGTPSTDYKRQAWIEYTFGRTTDGDIADYHDFGTPDWKTLADTFKFAVVIPEYWYNGGGLLSASGGAAISDMYDKVRALLTYLKAHETSRVNTDKIVLTGWSSGGTAALLFGHAFATEFSIVLIVNRHSAEASQTTDVDTSNALNFTLNSCSIAFKHWSTAPVWDWGDTLSDATAGSGTGSDTAFDPPHTNTWASNSSAKAIITYSFGGTNDPKPPSGPPTYMDYQTRTINVMAAQGYVNQYIREYDGESHDPQNDDEPLPAGGVDALHCKNRNRAVQAFYSGVGSFFSGTKSQTIGNSFTSDMSVVGSVDNLPR